MKTVILCVVLLLPMLTLAQSYNRSPRTSNRGSGRSDRTAAPAAAGSSYQVLSTRSMFVPDRTIDPEDRRAREDFVPPETMGVNREKVLTGVAMQEGAKDSAPAAFFFDPTNDETVRATVGQTIDGRTIRSITFEGVEIVWGRSIRIIRLGDNLSGVSVSLAAEPETPEATSEPTSEPSQFVSSPANTIEERMRQRRQQEK